jgi:hypothetical protein
MTVQARSAFQMAGTGSAPAGGGFRFRHNGRLTKMQSLIAVHIDRVAAVEQPSLRSNRQARHVILLKMCVADRARQQPASVTDRQFVDFCW